MKYELVKDDFIIVEDDIKLYRIKALKSFSHIERGQLGGYIESEYNLSQQGNCWVYGNAKVCGNAEVSWNAKVCGNAEVYGNAKVCGNAEVYGNAEVCGNAKVCGNAEVCGDAEVYGNAKVCGNAEVCGDAEVYGNAEIKSKNDIITISNIGSRNSTTTFFRNKDNHIYVSCGCFYGNIKEFEEKVKNTHKGNKHEEIYLKVIELAKLQICGGVQNV